jgi:hypothetical protein
MKWLPAPILACILIASCAPQAVITSPDRLFTKPTALLDQGGKVILTKRANGHAVPFDVDADGKMDVLLGCHADMNTTRAEILVLRNVGTSDNPKLQWPVDRSVKHVDKDGSYSGSCGCKGGGAYELHPGDWNGDGHFDIVLNTMWKRGVVVLLNAGRKQKDPAVYHGAKLHSITSHGKSSGGGDWNADGINDFVFPVNSYGWAMYPGRRNGEKGKTFASEAAFRSIEFTNALGKRKWFDRTPYAWNYSGNNGVGSDVTEIIAVRNDPANKGKNYDKHVSLVEYFHLDRKAKTCKQVGTIAKINASEVRLGVGDLNQDGCVDLLLTGGVFTKGQDTQIWVLYGKVKNVPAK